MRSGGVYHLSHTDKSRYWALQTPIIVLLLFCIKRLVDIAKMPCFPYKIANQFIYLFI